MNQQELEQIQKEFLDKVELVRLETYQATGYEWMVVPRTGAYRTIKEQHALYIQPTDRIDNDHDGLVDEADEKVTKADGGQSPHNYNLGRDIVPCKKRNVPWWPNGSDPLWKTMADIARKHGLVAGYYWTDPFDAPHIEHPRWKEVRAAWKRGEINVA